MDQPGAAMIGQCVLDASTALRWAFQAPDAYAERVLVHLRRNVALVPSIWWLEVGNALLVAERSGRSTASRIQETFTALHELRITTEPTAFNITAAMTVYDLARQRQLTTYDAAYLDLALRRQLPLATLDRHLQQAAEAEGVRRFDPPDAG